MKVYVVTQGEYSEKGNAGVFSTREQAERFVECFKDHGVNEFVEEFELDELYSKAERGLLPFLVQFDEAGNSRAHPADYEQPEETRVVCYENTFDLGRFRPVMNVFLWAKDTDHAVKIASEKRREWLAGEKGGGK